MPAWDHIQSVNLAKDGQLRVAWNAGSAHDSSKEVNFGLQRASYHRALRRFDELADTNVSSTQLAMRLMPGQVFILDNWRVLHGRGVIADGRYRHMVFADLSESSLLAKWKELSLQYHRSDL